MLIAAYNYCELCTNIKRWSLTIVKILSKKCRRFLLWRSSRASGPSSLYLQPFMYWLFSSYTLLMRWSQLGKVSFNLSRKKSGQGGSNQNVQKWGGWKAEVTSSTLLGGKVGWCKFVISRLFPNQSNEICLSGELSFSNIFRYKYNM